MREGQLGFPNERAAMPVLVAAAVAVLGVLTAKFVMAGSAYFIIVLPVAMLLGFVLSKNLQFGLFAYFCIAALAFGESPGVHSPHSHYRAGLMPSEVFLAFLVLLWLGRSALSGGRWVRSELNAPLSAFFGVSVLSFAMSNLLSNTRDQLFHQLLITQVAEVGLLLCSVCAFFLAANTLRDEKWIRLSTVPVIVIGAFVAVFRLADVELPIAIPWSGFFLAAGIAVLYSRLLFEPLSAGKRWALALFTLVLIAAAYANLAWVSGWVAVTGAILVVTWYRSKGLALLLAMVGLFLLFVYPGAFTHMRSEAETGGDYDRFTIWRDAYSMFMDVNPALGVGPGNYYPYVQMYNTLWWSGRTYTTAHSNYAQVGAETGIVGFVVFLWVLISALRAGNSAARRAPPQLRWLGVAATAYFAGMIVAAVMGDYIFPSRGNNGIVNFGTTVYLWLIMGAAVAASNLERE
ncbi:MAG: O-antigen ligase family protein [Armatimonadota bacterium]